jgi:cell division protein FtsI (penicillin-binding protein 3)
MKANLMQLLRAYSAFDNNGKIVMPKMVNNFLDEHGRSIPIVDE